MQDDRGYRVRCSQSQIPNAAGRLSTIIAAPATRLFQSAPWPLEPLAPLFHHFRASPQHLAATRVASAPKRTDSPYVTLGFAIRRMKARATRELQTALTEVRGTSEDRGLSEIPGERRKSGGS